MKPSKIGLRRVSLRRSKKPKEGITESGLMNQQSLFGIKEFQVQNEKALLTKSIRCSNANIQTPDLSLILPHPFPKIDVVKEPFWNSLSMAIHCTLWQPHRIESLEPDSLLLNGLLNYQEGESNFWKNQIIPNNSTPQPSLPSLLHLSIPIDDNFAKSVITAKKIRIYPQNEKLWFEALNLDQRAYNLTIEFMRKGRKPHSDFRTQICDWCIVECEQNST